MNALQILQQKFFPKPKASGKKKKGGKK